VYMCARITAMSISTLLHAKTWLPLYKDPSQRGEYDPAKSIAASIKKIPAWMLILKTTSHTICP